MHALGCRFVICREANEPHELYSGDLSLISILTNSPIVIGVYDG